MIFPSISEIYAVQTTTIFFSLVSKQNFILSTHTRHKKKKKQREKETKTRQQNSDKMAWYSLSDAFAVPASSVRVFLADRVGQSAVEGPRPDDTGQEIAQLHVQLRW